MRIRFRRGHIRTGSARFNGTIPLIAIQMQALKVGNQVTFVFTTVVDELTRGLEEEDEDTTIADRAYWEKRGSKQTLGMADQLLGIISEFDPALELKYNKFYIGVARRKQPRNFIAFKPRKSTLIVNPSLSQSDEIEAKIEASGLDTLGYDKRGGRYQLRLRPDDLKDETLRDLLRLSYDNGNA